MHPFPSFHPSHSHSHTRPLTFSSSLLPNFNFTYSPSDFLGKGFTSQVFRGRSKITGFPLAIKLIDINLLKPQDKTLIASQITSMRKLRGKSPYLLNLIQVNQHKNLVYIVTEQCDYDLTRIIQPGKSMLERNAIELIQEIVKGYLCIARNGIVHRDLKPANIFLKNNHVKIGDFGFAIREEDCARCHNVGSPLYMAPECLLETRYSVKSDIWALGVIYFEMLFGETPWNAENEGELVRKMVEGDIRDVLKGRVMGEKSYLFLERTLVVRAEDRMGVEELEGFSWRAVRPVSMLVPQSKRKEMENPELGGVMSFQKNKNNFVGNGYNPNNQNTFSNLSKPNNLTNLIIPSETLQSFNDSTRSDLFQILSSQLLLCQYFLQLSKQLLPLTPLLQTNTLTPILQKFILKILSQIKSTSKSKSFSLPFIQQFWLTPQFQTLFASTINFQLKLRQFFPYNPSTNTQSQTNNNYCKQVREQIMNTITSLFLDSNEKEKSLGGGGLTTVDRKYLLDSLVAGYELVRLAAVGDAGYFSKNSNVGELLEAIRVGPKST